MLLVVENIGIEGPGLWEGVVVEKGVEYRVVEAYEEDVPTDPEPYSHVLILGGPMSANEEDKYPFLTREMELISSCVEVDKPLLGICLGAQLVAKTLGSRIYPAPAKEIGWYTVELTRPAAMDFLFSFMPKEVTVFQWHGETFDLPRHSVRLAASEVCPNQAFRFKNHIYGLQFHLEVTQGMVNTWKDAYKGELKEDGAAIPSFVPDPRVASISWEFFSRFLQFPRSFQ
ncbi:MAG: hypothetical protein DRI92_04165 [Aquificota bacterium]|nr:MAG: hypothetical protein DRI92_04165 [Aquificota bacterium]